MLGIPVEEGGEVGGQREADYGVFFFLGGVVVWAAQNTGRRGWLALSSAWGDGREFELGQGEIEVPYVCTSFTMTLEVGVRGASTSENAIRAATTKATVVKKPKTFCARTTVECMIV